MAAPLPLPDYEMYNWISRANRRASILAVFSQPLTVTQLSWRASLQRRYCSEVLSQLLTSGHVKCLNRGANCYRVYWVTSFGKIYRRLVRDDRGLAAVEEDVPRLDWGLHGRLCSGHRRGVLRMLTEALRPSRIKRKAWARNPRLRMSANNVRDVIRFFRRNGIVEPVFLPRERRPSYQCTRIGLVHQRLVVNAENGRWRN